MEFNPDGSLKIPKLYEKKARRMNIRKDILSEYPPKSCILSVKGDCSSVRRIFDSLERETPMKLSEADKGFEIVVGSDFKRCSDCRNLVYKLSAAVQGDCNIDNGTCSAKGSQQVFCYEDYFE
jgi:hypothetical protein